MIVALLDVSPLSTHDLWSSAMLHQGIGHLSYESPSPLIAQFDRERVLVYPRFLYLRIRDALGQICASTPSCV